MRGMDLIEVARQCPDLTVSIRLGDLIEANQSLVEEALMRLEKSVAESRTEIYLDYACHPSDRITSLALRFPLPYHGLSYRPKQKHVLLLQNSFFRMVLSLTRASSRRSSTIRKKHSTFVECFCFGL